MIEVKAMIPEKFFDFGQVKDYHLRNKTFHMLLTIVRDQLTSVETDEIQNNRIVSEKAPKFTSTFFNLRHIQGLNVTDTRRENFAEKRHEKRSYGQPSSSVDTEWVGPGLSSLDSDEIQRTVSISDPSVSSVGSRLYTATQEHESELLAQSFCQTVLYMLFLDNASVMWATGRDDAKPILEWRNRYD